jgi:phosphoenolpyruvate synthase/pyruvate phosphate dikinase
MSTRLKNSPEFLDKFKDVNISVPKTLVVSTEAFDAIISENNLRDVATGEFSDEEIIRLFTTAQVPEWLKRDLEQYLDHVRYPLAVRSPVCWKMPSFSPLPEYIKPI